VIGDSIKSGYFMMQRYINPKRENQYPFSSCFNFSLFENTK